MPLIIVSLVTFAYSPINIISFHDAKEHNLLMLNEPLFVISIKKYFIFK